MSSFDNPLDRLLIQSGCRTENKYSPTLAFEYLFELSCLIGVKAISPIGKHSSFSSILLLFGLRLAACLQRLARCCLRHFSGAAFAARLLELAVHAMHLARFWHQIVLSLRKTPTARIAIAAYRRHSFLQPAPATETYPQKEAFRERVEIPATPPYFRPFCP